LLLFCNNADVVDNDVGDVEDGDDVNQATIFCNRSCVQELWIEPMALVPRDVPKYLSQPIVFEPSARLQGSVIINAAKLKAGLLYEVQCEDYRGDVLRSLTDEEVDRIKEIFDSYDANGDGSISKYE